MTFKRKGRVQPAKKRSDRKCTVAKSSRQHSRNPKLTKPRKLTITERHPVEFALVQRAILDAALSHRGSVTSDIAHQFYELPSHIHQSLWGLGFLRLLGEAAIRPCGWTHTKRRMAHGRGIKQFHTNDLDRARQMRDAVTQLIGSIPSRPRQRVLFDGEGRV
jgi:hypothetical protein